MRCGLSCHYERRNVRKDLSRWSRTVLVATGDKLQMTILSSLLGIRTLFCGKLKCHHENAHSSKGIENIVSHLVGKATWEAICPASSLCLNEQESDPVDFVPNELCLLCDHQREPLIADIIDNNSSMSDSASGVCSSDSPSTSPHATHAVMSTSTSTDANMLNMTNFYERTREAIMRIQAAQQC
uniref:RNA helicase n=1 Tax=Angiostrongylus cantonensis TaxID=6313 RepID=A0A0K0D1N5_ANGCA